VAATADPFTPLPTDFLPMSSRNAFSLIEVTMALGIIGFSILPLVKLMSLGFVTMQDANCDVRAAIIARQVIAEAQRSPFDGLQSTGPIWMDYEGNALKQSESANAVFEVYLKVNDASGTGNPLGSPNLAKIRVTITGAALGNRPRMFNALVANMGD